MPASAPPGSAKGRPAAPPTPCDAFAAIDPGRLRQIGQATLLALMVWAREVEY